MKRFIFIFLVTILITACSLFSRNIVQISWPDNIQYIEALCELDISFKDSKYSGSMSMIVEYPDTLLIDVYGPFGDTVVHIQKEGDRFLLITKEKVVHDEAQFRKDFGINLNDFIEDVTRKAVSENNGFIDKKDESRQYKVRYSTEKEGNNNICWDMKDGNMCITFLEAKFSKH